MERFVTKITPTQSFNSTKLIKRRSSLSLSSTKKNASKNIVSLRDQELLRIWGNKFNQNAKNICNKSGIDFTSTNLNTQKSLLNDDLPPLQIDTKIMENDGNIEPLCVTPPAQIQSFDDVLTPKRNPCILKLQRDLNSPSANTRVRALRALKSQTQIEKYCKFDIPYEEQDIITAEERKTPPKPKTIQEVFKDVVVYVEERTGGDNRSSGIKKVIAGLGAKVNDKLLRTTTHVIFKDGKQSTYNKAKKWNIPMVSILWIEATKKFLRLANPNDFPIFNIEKYENPDIHTKIRKYKSMQPDAEKLARRKIRPIPKPICQEPMITNNLIVSPPILKSPRNNNLNEILLEFQEIIGTPDMDPEIYPVNSKLLERIRNLQFERQHDNIKETPSLENQTPSVSKPTPPVLDNISSVSGDFTPPPLNIDKEYHFNLIRKSLFQNDNDSEIDSDLSNETSQTISNTSESVVDVIPRRVTRRSSILIQEKVETNDIINSVEKAKRRSSINHSPFISNSNSINDKLINKTPRNTSRRKTIFEFSNNAIMEDTINENKETENENINKKTVKKTDLIIKPLNKRTTTYTPKSMDKTNIQCLKTKTASLEIIKPRTSGRILCTPKTYKFADKNNDVFSNNVTNRRHILSSQKSMNNSSFNELIPMPETPKFNENKRQEVTSQKSMNNSSFNELIPMPETPKFNENKRQEVTSMLDISKEYEIDKILNEKTPLTTKSIISFNSTRQPVSDRRRTMFDLSRDIIDNRLNEINRSSIKQSNEKLQQNSDRSNSTELGSVPETICTIKSDTLSGSSSSSSSAYNCTKENENSNSNVNLSQSKQAIIDSYFKQLCKTPPDYPYTGLGNKKRKLFNPNQFNDFQSPTNTTTDLITTTTKTPISKIIKKFTKSQSEKKRLREVDEKNVYDLSIQHLNKKKKTIEQIDDKSKAIMKTPKSVIKNKLEKQLTKRRSTMDFEMINSYRAKIDNKKQIFPCLVYTNMHQKQIDVIKEAIEKLGGFKLDENVSEKTTHLITLENRRTINFLKGIIFGVWILRYEWLIDSLEHGNWLDEEQYEMKEFSSAVERCRSDRQAYGSNYKIKLFLDIGPIYLSTNCKVPIENLKELILLCSGKIVINLKKAKYYVGEKFLLNNDDKNKYLSKLICVKPLWILDSISNNKILKIEKYLLKNNLKK